MKSAPGEAKVRPRTNRAGVITHYDSSAWINGHRHHFRGATPKDVRMLRRDALAKAGKGKHTPPSKQTLGDYLSWWLQMKPYAAYSTRRNAVLNVKRIAGKIGHLRLDKLTAAEIQECYASLAEDGLDLNTVGHTHGTLRKALDDAVIFEKRDDNPAAALKRPKAEDREMHFYHPHELVKLFNTTKGDRYHAMWVLLGTAGLRISEAQALRWSDLDLEAGTLSVQRTVHRETGRGMRYGSPKTKQGRRKFHLLEQTCAVLREHQKTQAEFLGALGIEPELVISSSRGTPADISNLHRDLTDACQRAGIPRYRPHDLRHTTAAMLLEMGINPVTVAKILGHTSAAFTLGRYGHCLPSSEENAAKLHTDALRTAGWWHDGGTPPETAQSSDSADTPKPAPASGN